ncbi:MAG: tetratricopeptide repeat protein [Hyphomicrobiales bacterium]|nr:tetratricopeptide repeat protein [Hyphomicrobiales bacterium]
MTSRSHRTPERETPGADDARDDAGSSYASIEALLRQYVDRVRDANQTPPVAEMQGRVSSLAQTLAETSQPLSAPSFRRKYAPADETPMTPDPAPRQSAPRHAAPRLSETERQDAARAWLDQRFSELRLLIETTAGADARKRDEAIERRIEDIMERLNAMQREMEAGSPADRALKAQLRQIAEQVAEHRGEQGAALQQIGVRLDRIGDAADKAVVAAGAAGARAEAAVADAATRSSRQTFELTARHLSEALKQTAPAARFAAIESEVRALNHQSRETGQRTARALEDVHGTLRQFLEHVSPAPLAPAAPPSANRRPGLATPVREPRFAPGEPPPLAPTAAEAPISHTAFAEPKDDEFEQESSRRVRTGLVIGVMIMLAACLVLLGVHLFNGKAAAAHTGKSGKETRLQATAAGVSGWTASLEPSRIFTVSLAQTPAPKSASAEEAYRRGAALERASRPDYDAAAVHYRSAAERGHARAMHHLGVISMRSGAGRGAGEALRWFGAAARLGVADSQFNLAVLLERGVGGAADMAGAYYWYSVAAANGDAQAALKADALRAKLTRREAAEIDKRVRAFEPARPALGDPV